MPMRLKKDDLVKVISGKAKDSTGKIVRVFRDKKTVLIEGVNKAKKHQKPNQQNEKGGIIDKEMPVSESNVMLISPKSNQPVRTTSKKLENGKKVRVERKTGTVLE